MPCSNPLQYHLVSEDLLCNRFSQNSNMQIGDNPVNLYFYKKYVIRKATATPKAQLQLPIGLHTEGLARYFWSTANCDSIAKFCSHTPQSNRNSIVNMSEGQSGLYTCLQLTSFKHNAMVAKRNIDSRQAGQTSRMGLNRHFLHHLNL